MQAGDAAGAEASFRQSLAIAPDFAEPLANLALLRERTGAIAEAEQCYRRAMQNDEINLHILCLFLFRLYWGKYQCASYNLIQI